MSVYYCESCLTNENTYIDGNSLPITIAGQPNVGFNIGSGFDGLGTPSVRTIQLQSDGRILVGGDFSTYSGALYNGIIRLNTDASIDTTFVIGTGIGGSVRTILTQPDGKILVGGAFSSYSGVSRNNIIRLNTDGSIDTSFVIGTGFNVGGVVNTIQLQSDGKILVGGGFTTYSGVSYNRIIRLNTDGSIDTSFVIGSGFNGTVQTIQLQPDGKILVGGQFTTYSGVSYNRIIRLNTDGSIDTSFVIGSGFNGTVSTIQLQPDGKILAGGTFTSYSGVSYNRIIRLNTDGSIDTSFVIGSGFPSTVQIIRLQSDGKILVGGVFTTYSGVSYNRIIRLNTDGSVDDSFVIDSGFNSTVFSIELQPNGEIIVGGSFISYNNYTSPRIAIINQINTSSIIYATNFKCYNPLLLTNNGLLDLLFKLGSGFSSTVFDAQLQPDGKILVGGEFSSYNGVSRSRIIRLNTDGSIDDSFVIGTGFNSGFVSTIQLQSDGKILVGGNFSSYSGISRSNIIRLNTDGSVDTSFVIGTGFNTIVRTTQLQPDGKILVGGDFSSYSGVSRSRIIRLNTDGSIDTSFVIGTGFNIGGTVYDIEVQSDGKILVGGLFTSYNGISKNNTIRLNFDGSIDTSFVIGTGFNNIVRSIKLRSDGKILFGGSFINYNSFDLGDLNPSFNPLTVTTVYSSIKGIDDGLYIGFTDGIRKMNSIGTSLFQSSTNDIVYSLEELSDSNILVAGSFGSFNGSLNGGLVKVDTSGNKVAGFDVGYGFVGNSVLTTKELPTGKILVGGDFTVSGSTIIDITFGGGGLFDNVTFTAVDQSDGKILVGGNFTSYSGVSRNRIIRLNTDGSVDNSFTIGNGFNTWVYTIGLQLDGKILVGGDFTSYSGVSRNRIIRLNTDGSVDTSFVIGIGFGSTVNSIELQSDGKILVGGLFTSYSGVSRNYIIRLNTDGSIDTSFVIGTGFNTIVRTTQLQPDGKILVGGDFSSYSGVSRSRIIRLNTDGSVDTSFVIGTGFNGGINTIQVQPDGKILVGGAFTSYSGISRNRIIRLNTDGSVDTSFVIGTGFNTTVQTIQLQPDGKILVGGDFSSYSGVSRSRIIRLNTDGSIDTSFVIGTGANNTVRGFIPKTGFTFVYGVFSTINGTPQRYFSKINYNGSTGTTVNRFTRINSDGGYDTTFSANTGFTSTVRKIDTQTDNKIIVAGDFTSYSGQQTNRILRLNTDYTLDTSFDTTNVFDGGVNDFEILSDGKILVGGSFTKIGGTGFIGNSALVSAIQPDGKIILGGVFTSYNNVSYNRIIRLNTDGSIDTSFVIGTGFNGGINTIQVQPDGKILVGGAFTSYSGVSRNSIIRLNTDGSIDTSFVIGTGFNDSVQTIELQPDGKILVGGGFTSYSGVSRNFIIRLNTDGSIDTSFIIGTGFNGSVWSIALQSDGKILVGGEFFDYDGNYCGGITRLETDGSIDFLFSSNITFGFDVENGEAPFSIVVESDGNILIGGTFFSFEYTIAIGLIRIDSDGILVTAFNDFGITSYLYRNSIVIQTDGKIIINGSNINYGSLNTPIMRINTDNTYDSTFLLSQSLNLSYQTINQVSLLNSGDMIIIGSIPFGIGKYTTNGVSMDFNGITLNRIARLNNDGTVDISFNVGTGFDNPPLAIQSQSDGKILVGGYFTTYSGVSRNRIIRLNTDGSIDTSFVIGTGFNFSVRTMTQTSNDYLLVGGEFTTYDGIPTTRACELYLTSSSGISLNRFAVLNTDGSVDTSVNIGTGFSDEVRIIQSQPDGKMIVGGSFTSYSGISSSRIIRLNDDYTNDVTFDIGTGFNTGIVYTITLQPDEKILVGGQFTLFDGNNAPNFIRLYDEEPTAEYQAMFLFGECEECNGYIIPISANTEYDECRICNDVAVSVDPPHPVWTGLNGGAVTQMNAVLLGGNGLNS